MAAKVKVEMRVSSWSSKRGDVVEVDKATADRLVENGYAVNVGKATKEAASE